MAPAATELGQGRVYGTGPTAGWATRPLGFRRESNGEQTIGVRETTETPIADDVV